MPRPVVCPHCQEELDIPAEFRGRQVRCASCQKVFVSPADSSVPPLPAPGNWEEDRPSRRPVREDYDRPGRRPDRDDSDRFDDRAPWDDRPGRPKKKSTLWLWLLILGFFGLCVLPCGGLLVFGIALDHPTFEPYDSAEGRFAVEFPGKPVETREPAAIGGIRYSTEYRRSFPEELYYVHYLDLPVRPATDRAADKVFQDACDRTVRNLPGGTEVSRSASTTDGHSAMDLHVDHPGGVTTLVRFVLDGRRLYAVGLTGPGLVPDSQRWRHFVQSFQVQPVPAKEK